MAIKAWGPYIGPHYEDQVYSPTDDRLISLAFGFTLGFGLLTCGKGFGQMMNVWKRKRTINVYIALIWIEVLASFMFALLTWLISIGTIKISIFVLVPISLCWSLQVQALLQIIINRLAILVHDKRQIFYIKYGVAFIVTLINISVIVIWNPARLQVNERWIEVNDMWDRVEKVIYLALDGCLNAYFIWLVHSRLLAIGMTKYRPLFTFNVCIVFVSLSMDALIISMLSLKNTWVYTQFQSLAYMVKLLIELTMASLLARISKKRDNMDLGFDEQFGSCPTYRANSTASKPEPSTRHLSFAPRCRTATFADGSADENAQEDRDYNTWLQKLRDRGSIGPQNYDEEKCQSSNENMDLSDSEYPIRLDDGARIKGFIMKTTETQVKRESIDSRRPSSLDESMKGLPTTCVTKV